MRALMVLLVAIGLCALLVSFGPTAAERLLAGHGELIGASDAAVEAFFTVLIFGALAIAAFLGGLATRVNPVRLGDRPVGMALLGLGVGLLGVVAATAYSYVAGAVAIGEQQKAAVALLGWGALLVLFQALSEEIYFRGWLQPVLVDSWGAGWGVAATALAFAGLHAMGGTGDPISLINMVLGGLLFGVLTLMTRGIVAATAAHFAWNAAEYVGLGLLPNPGVGAFGAAVDLDLAGSALWGGSDEGLNASVAMTIALLAFLVPLILFHRRAVLVGNKPAKASRRPARPRAAETPTALPATASTASITATPIGRPPDVPFDIRSDAVTHQGCVREANEDGYASMEAEGLWAVADGMGGHERGDWASATLLEQLRAGACGPDFESAREAIASRIKQGNGIIYKEASSKGTRMGSTVVALLVRQRRFAVLWVGDSRAYVARGGVLRQLSRDHSKVQDMVDRGLLNAEDAQDHPMGHILSRAVGAAETVEIEIAEDDLQPGDVFLLCSDGLHGCIGRTRLEQALAQTKPHATPQELVALALERGAPDNVTAITVDIGDPVQSEARQEDGRHRGLAAIVNKCEPRTPGR